MIPLTQDRHPNLIRIDIKGSDFMRITTYGKNIEVTNGMKRMAEEKLGKLECYFKPETEVKVTFSVQNELQKVEVTIPMKGTTIRAEEVSDDMYASIDLVEDAIERQLRRHKKKLISRRQSAQSLTDAFFADSAFDEDEIRLERTKKFDVKPMDVEEACLQMDLLDHDFYVFKNSDTDEINVVYKRKNGTYGLIEPQP